MRISDWSSDVCSSDLELVDDVVRDRRHGCRSIAIGPQLPHRLELVTTQVGMEGPIDRHVEIGADETSRPAAGDVRVGGRRERAEERRVGEGWGSRWRLWGWRVSVKQKKARRKC